jgi:hypothetical protein
MSSFLSSPLRNSSDEEHKQQGEDSPYDFLAILFHGSSEERLVQLVAHVIVPLNEPNAWREMRDRRWRGWRGILKTSIGWNKSLLLIFESIVSLLGRGSSGRGKGRGGERLEWWRCAVQWWRQSRCQFCPS